MSIRSLFKRIRAERQKETRLLHRAREQLDELKKGLREMTAFADRLRASVSKLTTVKDSVSTLLTKLSKEIRDNIEDPAALGAIVDELDADNDAITADVAANTPAATE